MNNNNINIYMASQKKTLKRLMASWSWTNGLLIITFSSLGSGMTKFLDTTFYFLDLYFRRYDF